MNLLKVLFPFLFVICAIILLKLMLVPIGKLAAKTVSSLYCKSAMGAGNADKSENGNQNHFQLEFLLRFIFSGFFFSMLIYAIIGFYQYLIKPNTLK